jgi:hypothetical protein
VTPGERNGPDASAEAESEAAVATQPHTRRQPTTRARHCRCNPPVSRYAGAWREGFCYGFRDALRLAARRTDDLEVLVMLSRLAAEYELAGGDQ